jgi:hypothetical protein
MKVDILQIYYDLFDIFESIETLTEALKQLEGVKMSRCAIISHLENTRLKHFNQELNNLYDTDMRVLKAFKLKCKERGYQTTLEDFL